MKRYIFIILLIVFIPTSVHALEDSFYEGEYLPNFYIMKIKNAKTKYENMRVYRRNSDNKVVYSLESWETLNNNKTLTGYNDYYQSHTKLSKKVWDRVRLISSFGYGYKDHTDIKWYGVTQYMIWKEISIDSYIYLTDTLNGNETDLYDDEIEEINNLIEEHLKKPNIKTQYFGYINEYIDIVDDSNNLINYRLGVTNDLELVRVSNNEVKIKNKTGKDDMFLMYKEDHNHIYDPIVYIDDLGQDLLLPGKFERIFISSTISVYRGTLYMHVLSDEDASFEGLRYGLYDFNDKLIDTITTNLNNLVMFYNKPYGKYYIKALDTKEGYKDKTNEKFYVEINAKSMDTYYYNDKIDEGLITDISYKNSDLIVEEEKDIDIVEDNYEYKKEINNVPDTYTSSRSKHIDIIIIVFGIVFILIGKRYEKK